jgi:hypothetical protein
MLFWIVSPLSAAAARPFGIVVLTSCVVSSLRAQATVAPASVQQESAAEGAVASADEVAVLDPTVQLPSTGRVGTFRSILFH